MQLMSDGVDPLTLMHTLITQIDVKEARIDQLRDKLMHLENLQAAGQKAAEQARCAEELAT